MITKIEVAFSEEEIRILEAAAALELAEALHNLPEPGNDFLQELTLKSVREFTTKHPHLKAYLSESLPLD